MNAHIIMENRQAYFTLRGRQYPLNCSIRAIKEISKRHGSLDKFLADLGDLPEPEQLDALMWVVRLFMEQGAALQRIEGGEDIAIPPAEDFEVMLGTKDIGGLYAALNETIAFDMAPAIELEEPEDTEEKN